MEDTNAWFLGHHHDQVVAMMHKKFQDLLDYHQTKNRKILHLDWIAGNPDDPVKKEEAATAYGGMSAADRRMSDKVAEMVMKVTHGVKEWDPRAAWNKSMFYGDWLKDDKGLRQFFLEIQIKRISGADEKLLEECGISPDFVWLPLHDEKAPAITPMVIPPPAPRNPIPARALPVPGQVAGQPQPQVEHEEYASPPITAPSPQSPTSASADKDKDKEKDKGKAAAAAPVIVSSASAQPSARKRPPLPNNGRLALAQHPAPRSPPPPSPAEPAEPVGETYADEGPIYLAEGVDPFDALIPAHAAPAVSAADLHRHRQDYDRIAYAKREELHRTFAFLSDPAFVRRRKASFVYAVRVVAIPDSGRVVNGFTGPRVEDRYGTRVAQGGWVVPPLEERARRREERRRAYRNKGARPGRYEGLPGPQVQRAMPVKLDWTGGAEARYYGPAAPVWHETCDPCLEDVYWMVWQLLAGKQFLGFQPGAGFGKPRPHATGDVALLHQNPFKSPSAEAVYHSASYPRGKEL
ncbi:hypothetical protein VTH06DRAFT_5462 [Thermothelomyces fergusii]